MKFVIKKGVLTNYRYRNNAEFERKGDELFVPEGVTVIADEVFRFNQRFERVILPDGVTGIGNGAFRDCKCLRQIRIPDSVTDIGDMAFAGCGSLEEITLPKSLKKLGSQAFEKCRSLRSVSFSGGLTDIGEAVFKDCGKLESLALPEGITSIGDEMFKGCESLRSVQLPEGVTSIGSQAFYRCVSLLEITIPQSVTSLGEAALGCCFELQRLTIPAGAGSSVNYGTFMNSNRIRFFKLHPDDPVLRRDFSLFDIVDSLRAAEHYTTFSAEDKRISFLAELYYLRTHDEPSSRYVRENLCPLLQNSLLHGDKVFIDDIIHNTDCFTPEIMDWVIEFALEHGYREFVAELLEKKDKQLDYQDIWSRFEL